MQTNISEAPIFPTNPNSRKQDISLGILGRVALELAYLVLEELDIASTFSLRKTNAGAWQLLSEFRKYSVIIEYAFPAFCALLRTGKASDVTLREFYKLLYERVLDLPHQIRKQSLSAQVGSDLRRV
jgi:hypothetical protein